MSDTLRLRSRGSKRKPARRCAETVDGSDSLWKAPEKPVRILLRSGHPGPLPCLDNARSKTTANLGHECDYAALCGWHPTSLITKPCTPCGNAAPDKYMHRQYPSTTRMPLFRQN